jgi:hypothetical protein
MLPGGRFLGHLIQISAQTSNISWEKFEGFKRFHLTSFKNNVLGRLTKSAQKNSKLHAIVKGYSIKSIKTYL